MTAKSILNVFEQYQRSRLTFAQTINDLSSQSKNVEHLMKCNVIELLTPLLSDPVASIQNNSLMALGKLASHSVNNAQRISKVLNKILQCVEQMSNYCKRSAMICLKNIAKHSPELAEVVIQSGGLEAITCCLESFDSGVKEAAACAIAHIACHTAELARDIEKARIIPLLILCLKEPDICLKQTACLAVCEITKHTIDLAQKVVEEAHAVPVLVKLLATNDVKLKSQVYKTFGNICKHSAHLAESVLGAEILPQVLLDLTHKDIAVRRSATILIREIVKHNVQFAHLIVNSGGIAALMNIITENNHQTFIPTVVTLGYIAGHSDRFALTLLEAGLVDALVNVIDRETEDNILAASVWVLGHLGRHSAEHARRLAIANVFTRLVEILANDSSSEDLKAKCKTTLKITIQKCTELLALEPLLHSAPSDIFKYVLGQFSKVLPNDAVARRRFAASGSLRKLQEIEAEPGSTLMEHIMTVKSCYPDELIRYYTPNYPQTLLEQLESYTPQIPNMFSSAPGSDETADIAVAPGDSECCDC